MYKLKFIDSYRFMQNPLSSLVDNLSKINKKEELKNKIIISESDKKISQETLIKKFLNAYQLCNKDEKVFILKNIWTVGKNLMKHHYQTKNIFIAN